MPKPAWSIYNEEFKKEKPVRPTGSAWVWGMGGAALLLTACLTPMSAVYFAELKPLAANVEGYHLDPVDETLVFSKEGLQVKVRYLGEEEVASQIPGPENPYVLRQVDPRLGYRPKDFTLFQVSVVNPTFGKVRLDPEKAVLVTDRGKRLESYAINRGDARGGLRNFETYFLARGVQTGNTQKRYLEQMGKVRETIYHRNSPVFKGKNYTGKIVFEALPPETERVELIIEDFILAFGIHDQPTERTTLHFPFAVRQGVQQPLAERR